MNSQAIDLLSNASATGSWFTWRGGDGVFLVTASSYGTVKLQVMGPDGVTAIDVSTSTSLTANGAVGFSLPPGQIRANVSGATGVYAKAVSLQ